MKILSNSPSRKAAIGLTVVLLLSSSWFFAQEREDLKVLDGDQSHPRSSLQEVLNNKAFQLLEEREETVRALQSAEEVKRRQDYVREQIMSVLAPLPSKTPLNPRVTGTLERDEYRVEKIVYESRPHYFVTANLYLPKTGSPPYPGILLPLGHERHAKANEDWQRLAITYVRNGFVVLAYDPLGQGERIQLFDPDFSGSKVGNSTTEHTLAGTQCLLLGHLFMSHRVWDGIRSLDYLISRPEVDSDRIACTGNSGGGTMTAHLTALDSRIKVGVPSCYITSWKKLLQTIGPQDAEQNLPPLLARGIDHGDFLLMAAPRPYLIASAIQDFFPIEGARSTFQEGKAVYQVMGVPEKIDMVEADDGHGFTLPRRLAAYAWMNRWLKDRDERIKEQEAELEESEDLWATPTGQVLTAFEDAVSVFALHKEELEQLKEKRDASLAGSGQFQDRVRELIGLDSPPPSLQVRSAGQVGRSGYHIEKLVLDDESGTLLPALLFEPLEGGNSQPVIYLHESGKEAEAGPGEEIEGLVRKGAVVLAVDLPGIGETAEALGDSYASAFSRYFGPYDTILTALLIDKTLVGIRTAAIIQSLDYLSRRLGRNEVEVTAVGKGAAGVSLLHAAALDDRLKTVVIEDSLVSYESIVRTPVHRRILAEVVPDALSLYDLPLLAASVAPRRLWIVNSRNPMGSLIQMPMVIDEYAVAKEAYQRSGQAEALQIVRRKPNKTLLELLNQSDWGK